MASLVASLTFPLGGGSSGGGFPSQSFQGVAPLGGQASAVGGGSLYFNPNFPPNQSNQTTYTFYQPGGLIFLRWMPTPLTVGSTVVDLVMPGGYNDADQWYMALYTYSGTGIAGVALFSFNDTLANNQTSNSVPLGAPAISGSQCSTILGFFTPPGAAPHLVAFKRFWPLVNLVRGNNVIDLVMPGGPQNPQTWYPIVYNFNGSVLS